MIIKEKVVFGFIAVFYLFFWQYTGNWRGAVAGGDSLGYYGHLPSTFIYHDVGSYDSLERVAKSYNKHLPGLKEDKYGIRPTPTGKFAIKYSQGMAFLLLPAFTVAHVFCKVSGKYSADGFSSPYLFSIGILLILYFFIGLFFLYKVLIRYFDKTIVWLTIISLGLATNLLYFVSYNNVMSHAPLFTMYALLIYFTDSFYKNPTKKLIII